MKPKQRAILACMYLIASTGVVHAAAAANDPGDAAAPVPSTTYRSPFADYRVLGEDKSRPWIESNDIVRRAGGSRAQMKEMPEPTQGGGAKPTSPGAPPTPPVQSAPSAPPPHQHKHGG